MFMSEPQKLQIDNRDFKIQRRGRQGEHQKNNWFNKQNNNFCLLYTSDAADE